LFIRDFQLLCHVADEGGLCHSSCHSIFSPSWRTLRVAGVAFASFAFREPHLGSATG
jgi:hypothetical protein